MTVLDQYIQRFQNLPSFNIHAVAADGHSSRPWFDVRGEDIARELIMDELNLATQADTIGASIQKWGRLESQARRVWELSERKLRTWKAKFHLEVMESVDRGDIKKPTQAHIEAMYRTNPEYQKLCVAIERAHESYNSAHGTLEGFRALKDMLAKFAPRYRDG